MAEVSQSLIVRLTSAEPKLTPERQLKASLRRDLEWLLNTRRIGVPPPESMVELTRSLYNYGLPDFSSYSLNSPQDRNRLVRALETPIGIFQPRLGDVKITTRSIASTTTRVS